MPSTNDTIEANRAQAREIPDEQQLRLIRRAYDAAVARQDDALATSLRQALMSARLDTAGPAQAAPATTSAPIPQTAPTMTPGGMPPALGVPTAPTSNTGLATNRAMPSSIQSMTGQTLGAPGSTRREPPKNVLRGGVDPDLAGNIKQLLQFASVLSAPTSAGGSPAATAPPTASPFAQPAAPQNAVIPGAPPAPVAAPPAPPVSRYEGIGFDDLVAHLGEIGKLEGQGALPGNVGIAPEGKAISEELIGRANSVDHSPFPEGAKSMREEMKWDAKSTSVADEPENLAKLYLDFLTIYGDSGFGNLRTTSALWQLHERVKGGKTLWTAASEQAGKPLAAQTAAEKEAKATEKAAADAEKRAVKHEAERVQLAGRAEDAVKTAYSSKTMTREQRISRSKRAYGKYVALHGTDNLPPELQTIKERLDAKEPNPYYRGTAIDQLGPAKGRFEKGFGQWIEGHLETGTVGGQTADEWAKGDSLAGPSKGGARRQIVGQAAVPYREDIPNYAEVAYKGGLDEKTKVRYDGLAKRYEKVTKWTKDQFENVYGIKATRAELREAVDKQWEGVLNTEPNEKLWTAWIVNDPAAKKKYAEKPVHVGEEPVKSVAEVAPTTQPAPTVGPMPGPKWQNQPPPAPADANAGPGSAPAPEATTQPAAGLQVGWPSPTAAPPASAIPIWKRIEAGATLQDVATEYAKLSEEDRRTFALFLRTMKKL